MRRDAEAEVRVRCPPDVKALGVGEDRLVPIGGGVVDRDLVASFNLLVSELGVTRCGPVPSW